MRSGCNEGVESLVVAKGEKVVTVLRLSSCDAVYMYIVMDYLTARE